MSKYIAIEANIGRFSWGHKGDVGRFSPNGKLHRHGEADMVQRREQTPQIGRAHV